VWSCRVPAVRETTAQEYEAAIHRALVLALKNPACTPADLADAAGFSAFHFSRMFAGMVGESPGELLKRLRLERAALALKSRQRVTEVAFEAGYESLEAFSRAFRSAFGHTPSAFSKTGHAARLPAPSNFHITPEGSKEPVVLHPMRGTCSMKIEIRESVPPMRVVAMPHVGPYWQIGPVFDRLEQWATANNIAAQGILAIYHDDPESVPAEKLRSDACIVVGPELSLDDTAVRLVDLPGGRYAVATYVGSYSGLPAAWGQFMGEWLPGSGEKINFEHPSFEIYRNMPGEVPESELITELYEPLL
jgi:AraC family transcriptional regulator